MLSSRLPATASSFVLLVVALQCFAVAPMLRERVRAVSERAHTVLTLVFVASVAAALYFVHRLAMAVFLTAVGFIVVGGPFCFRFSSLRYKRGIRGPWDTAHVRRA